MAKALLGYAVATDPRQHSHNLRLLAENRQLRERVLDLESALAAAQIENEALSALATSSADAVAVLAPA